jgi:hypothetical protein
LAFAADKLMDDKLAANAEVVLRVKRLSVEGADKYAWYRVQVLQVFKNQSSETFTNALSVAAYSGKPGVPEGESTVYLERYNQTGKKLWKLVSGEASTAVSHVAGTGTDGGTNLTKQIADILTECKKIPPGTTRADLFEVFTTEGGISTATSRTFVHRRCPYIKVNVEFTPSRPNQKPLEERPTDTISKISRPYLEWCITD